MTARLLAFFVWGAVAASAVFWGTRLGGTPLRAPVDAVAVAQMGSPKGPLTRLLGAEPVEAVPVAAALVPEATSRFKLIGVVAPRTAAGEGIAVLSVDGKLAKPYRVGAAIEDVGMVLQGVKARGVEIGPAGGPTQVRLELPPPSPAATGTLPQMSLNPPLPAVPGMQTGAGYSAPPSYNSPPSGIPPVAAQAPVSPAQPPGGMPMQPSATAAPMQQPAPQPGTIPVLPPGATPALPPGVLRQ
ncbi:MAG TPA: type II secretion system protein N [Burkholderiaceae bacterium]|nr:type II secretion system protein N [Burkholderiaceae bacterium]